MSLNHEPTEDVSGRTREELKELKRLLELHYGLELHIDDGSLAYLHQVLKASGEIEKLGNDLRASIGKVDSLSDALVQRFKEIEAVKIPAEVKLIKENRIEVGDFWKRVHMAGAFIALLVIVGSVAWSLYDQGRREQQAVKNDQQILWLKNYVRSTQGKYPEYHQQYLKDHAYPK